MIRPLSADTRGKVVTKMGYCGDVCDYCPRYIATQSGSMDGLKEAAVLWHKAGARSKVLPPEEMICHGCSRDKACQYGVAQCASGKSLQHCGECSEYPCAVLKSRFDVVPKLSEEWKNVCTKEEYELIHKAFWQKKENLDKARDEYLSRK